MLLIPWFLFCVQHHWNKSQGNLSYLRFIFFFALCDTKKELCRELNSRLFFLIALRSVIWWCGLCCHPVSQHQTPTKENSLTKPTTQSIYTWLSSLGTPTAYHCLSSSFGLRGHFTIFLLSGLLLDPFAGKKERSLSWHFQPNTGPSREQM